MVDEAIQCIKRYEITSAHSGSRRRAGCGFSPVRLPHCNPPRSDGLGFRHRCLTALRSVSDAHELADPADRRYRHPFVNCTNCGPRFTIITGLPDDRSATTMANFAMCANCDAEYEDPTDRRFHAQPIGRPDCGPILEFVSPCAPSHTGARALRQAREWLASGSIFAIKGIGGYHLALSGRATIGGSRYDELARPLRVVGALLDAESAHPARTAYNHLLFLAQSQGLARLRVDEVLDLVGLHDVASDRTGTFSLGMRQRLGIAVALLGDPQVLILDEPINGLDPDGIFWIRNLMKELAGEGRTVFVSSHLMGEMAITADKLIVIGLGSVGDPHPRGL